MFSKVKGRHYDTSQTKQRFSIKKFKIGAASVLVGTLFAVFASQIQVYANENTVAEPTVEVHASQAEQETTAPVTPEVEAPAQAEQSPVEEKTAEVKTEATDQEVPVAEVQPEAVSATVTDVATETPASEKAPETPVSDAKEEASLPKQAPVTKPTVSFMATNTAPANPENNAQARPENEGQEIDPKKAFLDARTTDKPVGAEAEGKFSREPGIIYLLDARPQNLKTAEEGVIYEVDLATDAPTLSPIAKNNMSDGTLLSDNVNTLGATLPNSNLGSNALTINSLGMSPDGKKAYVLFANRDQFGAVYEYDFDSRSWSLGKQRADLADESIPKIRQTFTIGAVNPVNGLYYFGAADGPFNPDWDLLPDTKEAADEQLEKLGYVNKFYRLWSYDPVTKEINPAGYIDTHLNSIKGVKKNSNAGINGDMTFNENGDLLVNLDLKSALEEGHTLKTSLYEMKVSYANVLAGTEAKNNNFLLAGTGSLIGNEIPTVQFNGAALNDGDQELYFTNGNYVAAVSPDRTSYTVKYNFPSSRPFGDSGSVVTVKGNVKEEYYSKVTDQIIQGAEGSVVNGAFVPAEPNKATTGTELIKNREQVKADYTSEAPKAIKTVNPDGTVSVYRLVSDATKVTEEKLVDDSISKKEEAFDGLKGDSSKVVRGDITLKYKYEPVVGSVEVYYKDIDTGEEIKAKVADVVDVSVGNPYETLDKKPQIIQVNGKTYQLVPNIGKVTPAGEETERDLKATDESGIVKEGTTKITYLYKEVKGSVVVNYVDENGKEIKAPEVVKPVGTPVGEEYDATTDAFKPQTITFEGKEYELVPGVTRDVDANVQDISEKGTTPAGPAEITYVYREKPKGTVVVNYVDEKGNALKEPVTVKDNVPAGTAYNTDTDEVSKPEKFITKDGKTYQLSPTLSLDKDPSVPNVAKEGKVPSGTSEVTYVYKEVKGTVTVNYVDKNGERVADPKDVVKDAPQGTDYDATTPAYRPEKIVTENGKTYKLLVDEKLPETDKEKNNPDVPDVDPKGKVPAGKSELYYVYEEVKGSIKVNYVDEKGNKIEESKDVVKEVSTGTDYDSTTEALRPSIITKGDKVYELMPNITYDKVINEGAKVITPTGKVTEGLGEVTYVYREKAQAKVVFQEVDKDGKNPKVIPGYPDVPKTGTPGDSIPTATEKPSVEDLVKKGYKVVQNPLDNDNVFDKNPETTQEIVVKVTPNIGPLVPGAEDPKPGEPIDPTEPNGPKYTPELIKKIEDLRTEQVSRVITYVKQETPDGAKTPITEKQTVTETLDFKQTLEINAVTGEVTAKGDWTAPVTGDTFSLEKSPVVTGYITTTKEVPAEKVKATDEDKAVEVVYTPLGKFVPNVPEGYDKPELPVYPNDPEDPSKPGVPTTPIPYVPGLVPNGPDGNPLTPVDPKDPEKGYTPPTPTNPGEDTPINYVKDTQKVTITFVEEGTEKEVAEKESLTGESDTPINFTSARDKVAKLEKQGYEVVTNPVETDSNFDNDSTKDQEFKVVVRPKVVPVDPNSPTPPVPGQPVNPQDPNSPVWPNPKNPEKPYTTSALKEEVNRTVTYVKVEDPSKPTEETPAGIADHTDKVTFERTATVNLVTGDVTYGEWTSTDTTFDSKETPVLSGYFADKAEVPTITGIKATDADVNEKVVYRPLGKFVPNVPEGFDKPELPVYPNSEDPSKPGVPTTPIPHIPGLIPNGPDGNPLKPVDPTDPTKGYNPPPIPTYPGDNTPITYVKEGQKAVVTFIEESTKEQVAPQVYLNGESKSPIDFTAPKETVEYLKSKGYTVVTNPLDKPATYDTDESTTQQFEVVVKIVPVPVTPEKPAVPGQPIDPKNPTGPKWTEETAKKANDLVKQEVKRTITYSKVDEGVKTPVGDKAPTVEQLVKFTQTVEINPVTGEITAKGDWKADATTTDTFPAKKSPVVTGYITVTKEVPSEKVTAEDADRAVEVIYTPLGKFVPTVPPGYDKPELPVYPNDSEDPSKPGVPTTPIPYIPGLIPNGPDGEPLKPVDPTDPTKGYIPPVPGKPGVDTPIKYVPVNPNVPTPNKPGNNVPSKPGKEVPSQSGNNVPTTPSHNVPAQPENTVPGQSTNTQPSYMKETLPNTGENESPFFNIAALIIIALAGLLSISKKKKN